MTIYKRRRRTGRADVTSTTRRGRERIIIIRVMCYLSYTLFSKEWDDTLQAEAEDWASRCHFYHKKGQGENLAYNTWTMTDEELIKDEMNSWYEEKKNYRYSDLSCSGICSHYTNVSHNQDLTLSPTCTCYRVAKLKWQSYECFMLRAMYFSNKLLEQGISHRTFMEKSALSKFNSTSIRGSFQQFEVHLSQMLN